VTVVRAGRRILDEVIVSIPAAGITVVSGPSDARAAVPGGGLRRGARVRRVPAAAGDAALPGALN